MKYYKIRKIGQSLTLTIPKFVEDFKKLKSGDVFEVTIEDDKIIYRKVEIENVR